MTYQKTISTLLAAITLLAIILTGCGTDIGHSWTRSDMPTNGLEDLVYYRLEGTPGEGEKNIATLKGVNANSPFDRQTTTFTKMSGTKNQTVLVYLPDGTPQQALGMTKTKRTSGRTDYLTLEVATMEGRDYRGNVYCGAEIRLDFKQNLVQAVAGDFRDYESRWFYEIPCSRDGFETHFDTANARLLSVSLNHVWQFRVFGDPVFVNMQRGGVIIGGTLETLDGGWWEYFDIPDLAPNGKQDTIAAAEMLNEMVRDLSTSPSPWLEFTPNSRFAADGTWVKTSYGDADQYSHFDALLLNRQHQYAVFNRTDQYSEWDFITIEPRYDFEWNDVRQQLKASLDLVFNDLLKNGQPKDPHSSQLKEFERSGWMNAPNVNLDQLRWYDSEGNLLYVMTVRAHIGALDTLIMFSRGLPNLAMRDQITVDGEPLPIYDKYGNKLPEDKRPYTPEQWAEFQREDSFWNYLKDNPAAFDAELYVQYRFENNSTWVQLICGSGDHTYVCGYDPTKWDLSTSYYFDGEVAGPWLALQLLGPTGMEVLGFSYASGLFTGTGLEFAMDQQYHYELFQTGRDIESIFMFDARALNTPVTTDRAWAWLHGE